MSKDSGKYIGENESAESFLIRNTGLYVDENQFTRGAKRLAVQFHKWDLHHSERRLAEMFGLLWPEIKSQLSNGIKESSSPIGSNPTDYVRVEMLFKVKE